jgi:hypothetical protein
MQAPCFLNFLSRLAGFGQSSLAFTMLITVRRCLKWTLLAVTLLDSETPQTPKEELTQYFEEAHTVNLVMFLFFSQSQIHESVEFINPHEKPKTIIDVYSLLILMENLHNHHS